ncbi:glycine--tRNA ligase subunit beta [Dermacoccus sp. CCH2-D9]|uniref:glycine--tRNA ligase subunit beta n=1 Tax=Dermacoccus sp. CCH2-D9 TaxID=1768779 RepID=UPI000B151D4A|nr:glycine--tRNA ligase subunit beta [Dermacoccus sp. CCH2-D9]
MGVDLLAAQEGGAADELVPTLETAGFVLDPTARRRQVVDGALALAKSVGGTIDIDGEASLVDEITNLVEEPQGVLGTFEERYLELPEQILTTVMRKHQRYLPVRDASGTLMPYFVTMANGSIDDDVVRAGNESVLRARYEDAAFFWEADLKVPLDDFRAQIDKLTFENRLGSFAQRADRIKDVSTKLAASVELTGDEQATLSRAGALAKFDLSTAMVVELSSLAGTMAREYALKAGEAPAVADALFEMEKPRSAGDSLPSSTPGALLALADRFDLLTAMFAIGAKPTGSSDPFALRRAALGVVSILRGVPAVAAISVSDGFDAAAARLREQGVEVSGEALASALEFVEGRFGQQLRDEGVSAALVTALSPSAGTPGRAAAVLADVEALRDDEAFRALVQVTQRITRIVPAGTQPGFDASVLTDEAETTLAPLVEALPDHSGDSLTQWFADASGLTEPLNRFFDDVLVMADDEALKAARLGLLQSVIAKAPAGIDYKELDRALDV